MAERCERIMYTMSDATALQFYSQVCGLDAMAWAANDGSNKQIDKICFLDLLIDVLAPDLITRGYAPHILNSLGRRITPRRPSNMIGPRGTLFSVLSRSLRAMTQIRKVHEGNGAQRMPKGHDHWKRSAENGLLT
jgi:hypothetical protein